MKTHFMFNNFLRKSSVYEIMSRNTVKLERTQTIRRLRDILDNKPTREQAYARARAPTPTLTHTHIPTQKYVILIAFYGNNALVISPECYVTCTLRVLLTPVVYSYVVLFLIGKSNYFTYFKHHCRGEASTSVYFSDMY